MLTHSGDDEMQTELSEGRSRIPVEMKERRLEEKSSGWYESSLVQARRWQISMGGQAPKISSFHKDPLMIFSPHPKIFPMGAGPWPLAPPPSATGMQLGE